MATHKEILRNLPGVDKLLARPKVKILLKQHDNAVVKYCIRNLIDSLRDIALQKGQLPPIEKIEDLVESAVNQFTSRSLKKVLNATGVVVHTNLGRAPFSNAIIDETAEILKGYNNLEFDLKTGKRKTRYYHITELLRYLTGAEDVLVVNNNAAAVMMILRSFAYNKEVVVSRGELIEIGGSFRLPDIMLASDCKMVEVGTTNKTRIQDYETAVNEETALFFKAHQSNYKIEGFTQEASLQELVSLGKKTKIPVIYDMGSGLLRKTSVQVLKNEPDVKQTLAEGIDLVSFSGDKLLGASQAGIIAGKKEMIAKLKKEPILRALRVGKTTLALLETALHYYLNDESLIKKNNIFSMLTREKNDVKSSAEKLHKILAKKGITSEIVDSTAYCGGGAMPGEAIKSFAVRLISGYDNNKQKSDFAESMYYKLMANKTPVVSLLKKGLIEFDMLTIQDYEIEKLANIIDEVFLEIKQI